MQASYNITGQKNGANIWITLEQSILRTMPLQNNRIDTLRCIIFGTFQNLWRKALWKVVQTTKNHAGHCKHEQRSRSESTDHIKKNQISRWSGPREARMANMALTQLEMALRGEPTLRFKFYTEASSRIRKKVQASGNREELTPTSDNWWNASWWNKSWWERSTWTWNDEVWGFLNSRSRTHVHTPCRTHIFFAHFLCVTYRHRVHAWLKVFAACRISISISLSLFSCSIRHPCCSRTVTSTPRSRPHRLRRALPDPKARVKRTSARAPRSLATWPILCTPQVMSPKRLARPLL